MGGNMQLSDVEKDDVVAELARIHAGLTRTIAQLRDVHARYSPEKMLLVTADAEDNRAAA